LSEGSPRRAMKSGTCFGSPSAIPAADADVGGA
jgi:hypothetical protein